MSLTIHTGRCYAIVSDGADYTVARLYDGATARIQGEEAVIMRGVLRNIDRSAREPDGGIDAAYERVAAYYDRRLAREADL